MIFFKHYSDKLHQLNIQGKGIIEAQGIGHKVQGIY